jgi:hypothetical protein
MPVSTTTPGRLGRSRYRAHPYCLPSRNDVGAREKGTFAAQWLACALPCQRFADASRATAHDSGSMRFATPPP